MARAKNDLGINALKALGLAAGSALFWATAIERYRYTLKTETLPLLSPNRDDIKILHLSDFHFAPWQHKKAAWIKSLSSLNPDVIILTGDLLGHENSIDITIETLKQLKQDCEPEIYFVHGSNDYYGPQLKNPLKYLLKNSAINYQKQPDLDNQTFTELLLTELAAVNLNNSAYRSRVKDSEIVWFGVGDQHIGYEDIPATTTALKLATSKTSLDSLLRIGVTHAPYRETLNFLTDNHAELILAGHTHGGQLRIPGVGALTTNSDLPLHQSRGLSTWHTAQNHAFLNVSAGIGTSIYAPARFACPPEATLITLTARKPLRNL